MYKTPVTDPGKNSKHGRLILAEPQPGEFRTIENVQDNGRDCEDRLVVVFENGELTVDYDLDTVRQRAEVMDTGSRLAFAGS